MEKFLIGLTEQLGEKIQKFNHEIREHEEQEEVFQQMFAVLKGLENDFDSFLEENETVCIKLFSKIGINADNVFHYNKFSKILKHHIDSEYETDMIKETIAIKQRIRKEILTLLKNKLVKKRDNYRVVQLREEVENYSRALDLLWQVNNLKNMDKTQSLLLVDVLEKEISNEEEFLEIMKFLIKEKVSSQKKQVIREKSINRMIINKKANDVMKEISSESKKISKVISISDSDKISTKIDSNRNKKIEKVLSEEDKKIIEHLRNIFNARGVDIDITDDKLYKKLVGNKGLDIRRKLYFKDGKLDYNLIARDVNLNLIKYLGSDDEDEIFEIFRFIIEEDHKYQGQIIETEKLYSKVKEIIASFEFEEILDGDSNIIKNIKEEINELIRNTASLLETIQEVKDSGIDNEDLAFIKEEIDEDLRQYDNLKSKLEEKRNELKTFEEEKRKKAKSKKKKKFVPLKDVISPLNISNNTNVLIFLKNGNIDENESSLCIEDDLYADGMKDSMNELQKQLQKVVRIFGQQDIESIRTSDSSKINKLKDNELPDNRHPSKPWRLREGKVRFSYIVVNLCAENREKIQKMYNLNDNFLKNGQILLIGGMVLADNDDYDKLLPLCREITKNEEEIYRIINLFSNKASAKELDQVIRGSNNIYAINESVEELEKLYKDIDDGNTSKIDDINNGKAR